MYTLAKLILYNFCTLLSYGWSSHKLVKLSLSLQRKSKALKPSVQDMKLALNAYMPLGFVLRTSPAQIHFGMWACSLGIFCAQKLNSAFIGWIGCVLWILSIQHDAMHSAFLQIWLWGLILCLSLILIVSSFFSFADALIYWVESWIDSFAKVTLQMASLSLSLFALRCLLITCHDICLWNCSLWKWILTFENACWLLWLTFCMHSNTIGDPQIIRAWLFVAVSMTVANTEAQFQHCLLL